MKNYEPTNIRSMALLGHSGHGKTSIGDAMARLTGLNNRLGSVSDQTSLLDYEPEEKDRGGSLNSHFLTCEYDGYKIHIVDTPGDGDFLHDAHMTIQGTDAAVLVISATDGVETSTEKMSALAVKLDIPRAIFINKLDRERASHVSALAEIKSVLEIEPVLLQLPIGKEDGFKGIVDLVSQKAFVYSDESGQPTETEIPADLEADVELAVEAMIEAVAMADDELVERYLEEGTLTFDEIRMGLNKGILNGSVVPVLLGSASKNIGVDRLLWLSRAFPSGLSRGPVLTHKPGKPEETSELRPDPNGSLVALCFKSIIDPFVGPLAFFRVFSGSATTDTHPTNSRTEKNERLAALFHMVGKKNITVDKVTAGDIFAVPKLKNTHVGDTLYTGVPIALDFHRPPEPMISYVIKPQSRADEDKVRGAMDKMLEEDLGLRQTYDEVTKEIVLSGMGVNHITLTVEKMKRKYGVNVELGTPTVPYRETISGKGDVRYRHKKQTGGAGQFGEVAIRIHPGERGTGFVFENKTVGGVIPSSLVPSVEKGVRLQLEQGILAGFPVIDVHVQLYDGKSHPVDSKDIAFQIAGRQAIKKAVLEARPVLLEPIYSVVVTCPEDHVGDIMGDMNQRRARIGTMEGRGRNNIVTATVPLAEMMNYAPSLKSMTAGKGSYTMQFRTYDPVPSSMQDKLVKDVNRLKSGDDD